MIGRYEDKDLKGIWSDAEKYRVLYDIEVIVAEAANKRWGCKKQLKWKPINFEDKGVLQEIKNIEKSTKHDVAAFIKYICKKNPQNARFVHVTMTSSDLVDTHLSYCIKCSLTHLSNWLMKVNHVLYDMAGKYKNVKMLARTHGKHATPTMLQHKLRVHYDIIDDCYYKLTDVSDGMRTKVSGPVGIGSILIDNEEATAKLAKDLQLKNNTPDNGREYVHDSQVINRAWYFDAIAQVFKVSNVLNSLATDLRLLAQEEIGEFVIGSGKKQWGSSSMPHKVNPVKLERVCGINRLVKGYFNAFAENMTLWNERDISNSSVERIALPDIFHAVILQCKDLIDVLENGHFNTERIHENLLNASVGVYSNYLVYHLCHKGEAPSYHKAVEKVRELLNTKYKGLKVRDSFSEVYSKDEFMSVIKVLTEQNWLVY